MRDFAAAIQICVAVAVPMGHAHAWNIHVDVFFLENRRDRRSIPTEIN
jgi:hypothetical protein